MLRRSLGATLVVLVALPLFLGARAATDPPADLPRIAFNDNLEPAGTLRDGVLKLDLEIVEGDWRLLGGDEPGGRVWAFAEAGKSPTNPGPLIRVPLGTRVEVRVTNRADSLVVVRGLDNRADGDLEPLSVAPGATETRRFTADVEGTYFYWGSFQGRPLDERFFEDSPLGGALVVDGDGLSTDDRILVMAEWNDGRLPTGGPDPSRLFLTVNGRPYPLDERMEYEMEDSIRWRVINLSPGPHAFHLHGFFYHVNAMGDVARDTLYWPAQRRSAVTQRLNAGSTMQIAWKPNRPGGWIFHCHMNIHVVPNPMMGAEGMSAEEFRAHLYRDPHEDQGAEEHAMAGMGGLMTAVYIRPPAGWQPEDVARRELDLFVDSKPVEGGLSGRQFAYVLQEGDAPPAPDSVELPGSTLFLRKGEPTRIRVTNRTDEPTQVHWHGLEIESYYDGVAGVGGYPGLPTPIIQPGEHWDVYVTPDRAGSYMYHTHVNDLRQQGSGLYAPLIVLDEGETWDPEHDRIFIFGESPFRSDAVSIVNGGETVSEPLEVGTTYRLRLMQITVNRPATWVTLLQDGFPVVWTPVAKDAFNVPPTQRVPTLAQQSLAVGETYDHLFTPVTPGALHLQLRVANGVLLTDLEIPVVR